jgi:hypothetical protein
MPRVQLPDGSVADFPDTMSDAAIEAVLRRQFPPASDRPAGLPAGVDLPQLRTRIPPPDVGSTPTLASRALQAGNVLGNLGTGLAQSALGTEAGLFSLAQQAARKAGVPESWTTLTPEHQQQLAELNQFVQPQNTAQAVGKFAGDVGQFFIPGAGEEAVAARAAPLVGRALPLLRMGLAGLGAGGVQAAQTGDWGNFGTGALLGAGGSAIGQGIRAIAPAVGEVAMSARAPDRAYGRTPGEFIVERTTSWRPQGIAQQARDVVRQAGQELEAGAQASTVPQNLLPVRAAIQPLLQRAAGGGLKPEIAGVKDVLSQVSERDIGTIPDLPARWGYTFPWGQPAGTTVPIPNVVSPEEALVMRQALGRARNYNPALQTDVIKQAYDAARAELGQGLRTAIPGFETLNETMSSGIPVAERFGAQDLNAGLIQRAIRRFATPTGALASAQALGSGVLGAGVGAGEGYRRGGLGGAAIGIPVGILASEAISSPRVLVPAMRLMQHAPGIAPAIYGAVSEALRPTVPRRPGS